MEKLSAKKHDTDDALRELDPVKWLGRQVFPRTFRNRCYFLTRRAAIP